MAFVEMHTELKSLLAEISGRNTVFKHGIIQAGNGIVTVRFSLHWAGRTIRQFIMMD